MLSAPNPELGQRDKSFKKKKTSEPLEGGRSLAQGEGEAEKEEEKSFSYCLGEKV